MVGGSNRYPKPSNTTHKKEKRKKWDMELVIWLPSISHKGELPNAIFLLFDNWTAVLKAKAAVDYFVLHLFDLVERHSHFLF